MGDGLQVHNCESAHCSFQKSENADFPEAMLGVGNMGGSTHEDANTGLPSIICLEPAAEYRQQLFELREWTQDQDLETRAENSNWYMSPTQMESPKVAMLSIQQSKELSSDTNTDTAQRPEDDIDGGIGASHDCAWVHSEPLVPDLEGFPDMGKFNQRSTNILGEQLYSPLTEQDG
jgi:hypothetical protein